MVVLIIHENSHSLPTKDQDKLEGAPVHNLDAEGSVDFIKKRIKAVSCKVQLHTQVKCAAHDLIDNSVTGSYKGYSKVAKIRHS